MGLMLHVFKKDLRRLWWAAGLTLVLLGELARQDRWRGDYFPGSLEGWLNVILPFVWACLLGLVVEQDPVVGDRQFWITRPHRRASLLAAKLLFAAIFIHGGSFVADCFILSARGFSPVQWFPQLLWKQLILAAALTLPALAMAALFRNFTQFMVAALCAVVAIVILTGTYQFPRFGNPLTDRQRSELAVATVCAAAVVVIVLQYLRRKTLGARAIGIAAASLAAALYSLVPTTTLWAARSMPGLAARVDRNLGEPPFRSMGKPINTELIVLPVTITGVAAGQRCRMEQLGLEIVGADGRRNEWHPPNRNSLFNRPFEKLDFDAYLIYPTDTKGWIAVRMDEKLYRSLSAGPVTIRGKEGITLSRMGPAVTIPAVNTSMALGKYRCTGTLREDAWHQTQLKFECESPDEIQHMWAELAVPGHPPTWKQHFGDRVAFAPYVHTTWLSPLDRQQTTFYPDSIFRGVGSPAWSVPPEIMARGKVTVTPEFVTSHSLVGFELNGVRISDYRFDPGK